VDPGELARAIVDDCRGLGFHRVGIAPIEPARRHEVYREWLRRGHAGEMDYLADPGAVAARQDPRALLPEARTVVVVALAHPAPGLRAIADSAHGVIAGYARGTDYHIVLKQKLHQLARRLAARLGGQVAARPCVDTAALLERDLAERAGVGFVAKNTMLIAPGLGSYVMLGELLLGAEATPTAAEPERKRCGACRLCLDACPTGAFVDAYLLDARRCISYLTIEQRGAIPRELRPLIGTRIFGCDVCQEVCPFNAGEGRPSAPELAPRPELDAPDLVRLLELGAAQFRRLVRRSALRRVHRAQLMRNVCVALGNAGDPRAIAPLRAALAAAAPLVREHAAWALGRLGDTEGLRARLAIEEDPAVRLELERSLNDGG
jgi:epoxyqueuosine reductase